MGLFSFMAQIGVNLRPLEQGLARAKQSLGGFGTDVKRTFNNQLAGMFGAAAFGSFIKGTMDWAGELTDLSDQLDVSTDKLQEWQYAAGQTGAKTENVVSFFEKLGDARQKALDGNEEAIQSFGRFGVSMQNLKSLRTEDLGSIIAEKVKSGDAQKLGTDLKELGGKSATKLVAAFKAGLGDLGAEARDLGLIVDRDLLNKVDQFGDRWAQIANTIRAHLTPLLGWLSDALDNVMRTFQLLGAWSAQYTGWKDMLFGDKTGKKSFVEFLTSPEAQKIVDKPKPPPPVTPDATGGNTTQFSGTDKKSIELEKKLGEIADKNALKRLTDEQKIAFLKRKQLELEEKLADTSLSRQDRLKLATEAQELDGQVMDLVAKGNKTEKPKADAMQQIGGFVGNASRTGEMVDWQKRIAVATEKVARNTDPMVDSPNKAWF